MNIKTNFSNKISSKKAFTLAEVLITLSIIGVVAALTIPNLIKNFKNQEFESGFKTAYSIISQAVNLMKAEEGAIWANYNCRDNPTKCGFNNDLGLSSAISKYLIVAKKCKIDECLPSNLATPLYDNYNRSDSLKGNNIGVLPIYLNNGLMVSIVAHSSPNTFILFSVDTNGYDKKPNRLGYDLFMFQLMPDDRLLPGGAPNTLYDICNDSSTTLYNGFACAQRALTVKDYFKNLK